MQANESDRQKTAVEQLNFGQKTAKRVSWESWEFTVVGPHLVRVTNASYGFLKKDHSYKVGVEVRDGTAVPAECECPADMYHETYDCKHNVALAAIGGLTVLEAARNFSTLDSEVDLESATMADKLAANGGSKRVATSNPERPRSNMEPCPNGEEWCSGSESNDLPCFACYQPEAEEA